MAFSLCDYMGVAPSAGRYLAKAAKRGEGSHGGHIIGHTRSGKPIYEANGHHYAHLHEGAGKQHDEVTKRDYELTMGHYPGFTAEDHEDAAAAHEDVNNHTSASAHFLAAAKLGYSSPGDPAEQAATNNVYGSSSHKRHDIKGSSADALTRTRSGKDVPDTRAYGDSMQDATQKMPPHEYQELRRQNAARVGAVTPGFSLQDHKDAIAAHMQEADRRLRMADTEKTPHLQQLQRRFAAEHTSVALGHSDAATQAYGDGSKNTFTGKDINKPVAPTMPVTRTSSGKEIPGLDSPSYKGVGFVTDRAGKGSVGGAGQYRKQKDKKSAETMAQNFAHFSTQDHEEATQHHLRTAKALELMGKKKAAQKAEDVAMYHSLSHIYQGDKKRS